MRIYCICRRLHSNPLFLPGLCDALLGVHPAREMPTFEGRLCLPPCRRNTPCGEAPRPLQQQQHGWLWRTRYAIYISLHCYFNDKDVPNIYWSIERLDLSHLYPNLEVPGLTCPGRESNPGLSEHSRKEPSRQLVNRYLEHLHMSPRQYDICMYWSVKR